MLNRVKVDSIQTNIHLRYVGGVNLNVLKVI